MGVCNLYMHLFLRDWLILSSTFSRRERDERGRDEGEVAWLCVRRKYFPAAPGVLFTVNNQFSTGCWLAGCYSGWVTVTCKPGQATSEGKIILPAIKSDWEQRELPKPKWRKCLKKRTQPSGPGPTPQGGQLGWLAPVRQLQVGWRTGTWTTSAPSASTSSGIEKERREGEKYMNG